MLDKDSKMSRATIEELCFETVDDEIDYRRGKLAGAWEAAVVAAAADSDHELTRILMECRPASVRRAPGWKERILELGSLDGNQKLVKAMLRRGAGLCGGQDLSPPLELAALAGKLESIEVLLEAGAEVNQTADMLLDSFF